LLAGLINAYYLCLALIVFEDSSRDHLVETSRTLHEGLGGNEPGYFRLKGAEANGLGREILEVVVAAPIVVGCGGPESSLLYDIFRPLPGFGLTFEFSLDELYLGLLTLETLVLLFEMLVLRFENLDLTTKSTGLSLLMTRYIVPMSNRTATLIANGHRNYERAR
jgi:hypothetical protein